MLILIDPVNKEGMLKIKGSSPSVYSFEVTIIPL